MRDVIKMAREAGAHPSHNPELYDIWSISDKALERFAELVRAEALAEQPAQQEPKIDIYRSFEQWKSGNVLEHGVPRTEHYSEAQLDLVEMGWNYGYDAGRAVEQALDKKAENARELGLDYEPVCNKDPQGCWNVRCQLGKKCKNTPAQQEPVKFKCTVIDDAHPDGIPLSQWGQQGSVTAAQKDEVFTASIEFIGTLTGMQPPPIEVAPPEILKPFRDFTEKVCSIFATSPPAQPMRPEIKKMYEDYFDKCFRESSIAERTWVGLTDEDRQAAFESMPDMLDGFLKKWGWLHFSKALEAKLKEKNT